MSQFIYSINHSIIHSFIHSFHRGLKKKKKVVTNRLDQTEMKELFKKGNHGELENDAKSMADRVSGLGAAA